MVRIAGTIILYSLIWCLSICSLFAQDEPAVCKSFPAEYEYIDKMAISGLNDITCSYNQFKNLSLSVNDLHNAKLYFNVPDDFDITNPSGGRDISNSSSVNHYFTKGKTWVLLTADRAGQKVLTCRSFEFLGADLPSVQSNLCSGNPITLAIEDNLKRDKYKVIWGDGKTEDVIGQGDKTAANHIYNDYWAEIKVKAFFERDNQEVCASNEVVLKRDVPEATFLTQLEGLNDATEIKLKYLGNPDIEYVIESKSEGGSWQNASVAEAGEGQIIGLNPQQKYCFRLKTTNSCDEPFYSENIVCNIVVEREIISRNSMNITWNMPEYPSQAPNGMSLTKRNTTGAPNFREDFTDPSTLSYLDENLLCGTTYYYQVEANYPPVAFNGNDVSVKIKTSFIPKEISEAKVNQKPSYVALATFDALDETKINFTVALDFGDEKFIDKFVYFKTNLKSGEDVKIGEEKANSISQEGIPIGSEDHCFKFKIIDICGIESAKSDSFCTINLGNISNDSLQWTPYVADEEVFIQRTVPLYNIEYFDSTSNSYILLTSLYDNTSYVLTDFLKNWSEPTIKLRVLLNQAIDLESFPNFPVNLYSNSILYTLPARIFAPTVFTPNGSGPVETESFGLKHRYVKSGSFKVMDRFGNVLFVSKSMDDTWDGTDQRLGKPVPIGTYFYSVTAFSYDNKPLQLRGAISILK